MESEQWLCLHRRKKITNIEQWLLFAHFTLPIEWDRQITFYSLILWFFYFYYLSVKLESGPCSMAVQWHGSHTAVRAQNKVPRPGQVNHNRPRQLTGKHSRKHTSVCSEHFISKHRQHNRAVFPHHPNHVILPMPRASSKSHVTSRRCCTPTAAGSVWEWYNSGMFVHEKLWRLKPTWATVFELTNVQYLGGLENIWFW